MAKNKSRQHKVKGKKKNLNKVVSLDDFRESEMAEDIQQNAQLPISELETLLPQLPVGSIQWKMIILQLAEGYKLEKNMEKAWETLAPLLEHVMDQEKGGRSAPALTLETKANLLARVMAAGLSYALQIKSGPDHAVGNDTNRADKTDNTDNTDNTVNTTKTSNIINIGDMIINDSNGNALGAMYWLEEAVDMMQHYDRRQGKHQPLPEDWEPLTEELMRVASMLGHHQKVLEIERALSRLCRGGLCQHLAGIAAFNLQKYSQAAKHWEKMSRMEDDPEGRLYARIAGLAQKGAIPPFTISYLEESLFLKLRLKQGETVPASEKASEGEKKQAFSVYVEETTEHLEKGVGILSTFVDYFTAVEDGSFKDAAFLLGMLVLSTGDWGLQLAESFLNAPHMKSDDLPAEVRKELQQALENGFDPVNRITLYDREYELIFEEDKRLDATHEMAQELLKRKRAVDAKDLILQAMDRKEATTPGLVLLLSTLESQMGQWQITLELMNELERVIPDVPPVMFNQVLAMSKLGLWDEALRVIERMKIVLEEDAAQGEEPTGVFSPKEISKLEANIRRDRDQREALSRDIAQMTGSWKKPENRPGKRRRDWYLLDVTSPEELREDVAGKELPRKTTLRRGMKNMPVEWVCFACLQHNLGPVTLREEWENLLEDALLSRKSLSKILKALAPEERELLEYLLEKGGTSPTGPLVRKFGAMEGDGYFWDAGDEPSSTLGRLWSKCLIMVGRGLINGKRQKVALIPADLQPLLKQLL